MADAPVIHRAGDRFGSFVIERDGARLGELTYSMEGDVATLARTPEFHDVMR